MELKYALLSLFFHLLLFTVTVIPLRMKNPEKKIVRASVHFIERKKNDLLPRKQIVKKVNNDKNKTKQKAKVSNISNKKKRKESSFKTNKKDSQNFLKKLNAISENFANELDKKRSPSKSENHEMDLSYFEGIYALIKDSFYIPPHINRANNKYLSAKLRIFLAENGDLLKINLEKSSGDKHFDKAVIKGTKKITNFGQVPILMQDEIKKKGILVKMCPFECSK